MLLRKPLHSVRPGFTVLEMVVVMLIGAVLTGIAMSRVSDYVDRRGARNARDAFVYLAARARALAIERGRTVRLEVDPAGDRAWLVAPDGSGGIDTLESVAYMGEFRADVATSAGGAVRVCYTPRGYALGTCNSFPMDTTVRVTFRRAVYADSVTVRPLGQVEVH